MVRHPRRKRITHANFKPQSCEPSPSRGNQNIGDRSGFSCRPQRNSETSRRFLGVTPAAYIQLKSMSLQGVKIRPMERRPLRRVGELLFLFNVRDLKFADRALFKTKAYPELSRPTTVVAWFQSHRKTSRKNGESEEMRRGCH